MSRQVVNINNLKRLRWVDQMSGTGHLTYCAARLLPALSRLTPAYCTACLLCRLIFDLGLSLYSPAPPPSRHLRRKRPGAVPSAPLRDLRSFP